MATLPIEIRVLEPLEHSCRLDGVATGPTATAGQMLDAKVFPVGSELGESPVWSEAEQAVYSIDITGRKLHRVRPQDGQCTSFSLPGRATALARSGPERLVLAVATHLAELNTRSGEWVDFPPGDGCPPAGCIFNDVKRDRAGRLWAGTRDPRGTQGKGALFCITSAQSARRADSGLTGTNGIAWNPAGDLMYVADSRARVIFRYDFNPSDGVASNKRTLVECSTDAAAPDGLTVDRDGYIWCAFWDGARVERIAPDGGVDRILHLPVARPTSCTFGGTDLDILFVTTARSSSRQPGPEPTVEGQLFAIRPGVHGVLESAPSDF